MKSATCIHRHLNSCPVPSHRYVERNINGNVTLFAFWHTELLLRDGIYGKEHFYYVHCVIDLHFWRQLQILKIKKNSFENQPHRPTVHTFKITSFLFVSSLLSLSRYDDPLSNLILKRLSVIHQSPHASDLSYFVEKKK